jgi:RNA polymerase sigma-70 factor (ECF subfamily)
MEDNYNELLLRCVDKDRKAFQELYKACSPKLYSLALRFLKRSGLAEEILQESFLKIWNSAHLYNPHKGKAMTWMATITRNKSLDKLRTLKAKPQETETVYEGADFASIEMEPEDFTAIEQDVGGLMKCLDELQPEQKECILLSYYYGHTHQELAVKLNRPLGTVKAWIRRGLEKLRVCLQ